MYNLHDAVFRAHLLGNDSKQQLVHQTTNTPDIHLQVTINWWLRGCVFADVSVDRTAEVAYFYQSLHDIRGTSCKRMF